MTPGTIENRFSELLQKNSHDIFPIDLGLEGPLYTEEHPLLVKTRLEYQESSEREPAPFKVDDWFYESFEDRAAAEKKYPNIQMKFLGRPWTIFMLISGKETEVIVDFPGIGAAVLSKRPLPDFSKDAIHHHLVPVWLNYALSPELWGPNGKWTRFHDNLHQLFMSKELLSAADSPGYYPLKSSAEILEDHGFRGTKLEKVYVLVLPWTFSLTALRKLETIIRQEL